MSWLDGMAEGGRALTGAAGSGGGSDVALDDTACFSAACHWTDGSMPSSAGDASARGEMG